MARRIAFIGAGRLAQTLAPAWAAMGEQMVLIASRQIESARGLAARLPGCRAMALDELAASGAAVLAQVELVFVSVNDAAIASTVSALGWRAGQWVVHCSGATELDALQAASDADAAVGGFHPLQIFSDPATAAQQLVGVAVAVESADEALRAELMRLARVLGMHPWQLPAGARAAYHGAASFAASFMLSLLAEAVQVWASLGLDEPTALAALLPLARGTLASAQARGLAGALSGPISRGDANVVAAHLKAFDALGRPHGEFYRLLAQRQLPLAAQSGRLDSAALRSLEDLLLRR